MPSSDPIEFYPNRWALIRMALTGFLFVLGGALIFWHGTRPGSTRLSIAGTGAFGVLFFGWVLACHVRALFRNRPFLTVTDEGLNHLPPGVAVGFIPWDEIEDVHLRGSVGGLFVGIKLVHPEAVLDRLSPLHAAMLRLNAWLSGHELDISTNTLGIHPTALLALLREHLPARPPGAFARQVEPDPAVQQVFRHVRRRVQIGITLTAIAAACALVTAAREPQWSFLMPVAVGGWIGGVVIALVTLSVCSRKARQGRPAGPALQAVTLPTYLAAVCTVAMAAITVDPEGHHAVDPSGDAWAELVLLACVYLGFAPSFGFLGRQRRPDPAD